MARQLRTQLEQEVQFDPLQDNARSTPTIRATPATPAAPPVAAGVAAPTEPPSTPAAATTDEPKPE
jgi:hypothetical protein